MLLIVDPQGDFINGSLPVPEAERAMNALADYVCKNAGDYAVKVVTADRHPHNHCSFKENGGMWPAHCVAGSEGAKIWGPLEEALKQTTGATVYLYKGEDSQREEFSALASPVNVMKVKELIDEYDITHIDICGLAGDVCVKATLHDGIRLFGRAMFNVLLEYSPTIEKEALPIDDNFTDRPIITHFTDDDLYKFTMCCAVIDNYPRAQVKYRFFDRDNTIYPAGFAEDVKRQLRYLEDVVITDEEVEFMKRRCAYIPLWFYNFLKGFRYRSEWAKVEQDAEGHLSIEFEGCWSDTILLEVKVLAIVSELYYMRAGECVNFDYDDYYARSYAKASRMIEAGCFFSDFGTRRRASFQAQDVSVRAMAECSRAKGGPGRFTGTSNVYLAMKYDLTPVGTMAHEFVAAIAGMYGPQMSNHLAMQAWSETYRGALGTFLYDTYGWEIFSLNFSEDFANMFKGLRVDSGDNFDELDKIVRKYRSLGIDPRSKQVVFSNGLNVDEAIAINERARQLCQPSFGIGTKFTNDFPGVKPRNIVIKLLAVKITELWTFYNDTCKLSEDNGKHTGDPAVVKRFMAILHIKE